MFAYGGDCTMINRKKMVKLVCVTSLSVALIFSKGAFAFAAEVPDATDRIKAEETADVVQNFIDTGETGSVIETTEAFVDDSGDVTTTIPKDGNAFVTMKDEEGVEIGMSLPEELDTEEGIATDSGTVVYQSDDSADVCVQSITDEQDGITIDGVRELVIIKDMDAPKEYTFNFDLPDGYSLITSEEYCERHNKTIKEKIQVETGGIYIVDREDEIQAVIDAPWAKDANGDAVETNYTINELTLTQHIVINENSRFPIVADPTSHPNRTVYAYYSKAEAKKLREKFKKKKNIWAGGFVTMANLGGGTAISYFANPTFGFLWSGALTAQGCYVNTQYDLWSDICVDFKKKYVRLACKERWHHKGAYVATGKIKVSYTNSKG